MLSDVRKKYIIDSQRFEFMELSKELTGKINGLLELKEKDVPILLDKIKKSRIATKWFQILVGITVDGIFGPLTNYHLKLFTEQLVSEGLISPKVFDIA